MNSNKNFLYNSRLPKLLIVLVMMLGASIAWGQENQIKKIHHIETSYYTEGGYAMRKVNVDYRKCDGVDIEQGQLLGVANTVFENLPLLIDERAFIEAINTLLQSAYTPFIVEEADIAQCESELYPNDIFHRNSPETLYRPEDYLNWVHSLVGLPVDTLQAMMWNKKFIGSVSIRGYSNLKVFYTETDYIEFFYDRRLSPFSYILVWHTIGEAEVKEWQPIDDEALHSFYVVTGLRALDFIPSKAEILMDLFQGIPNHKK